LDDLDYKDKIKQLIELKKEIELYTNKSMEGDVINTSDYYMAVITPKFKYKKH
jgi:hypothetical protein